jgi:hypothetical protein
MERIFNSPDKLLTSHGARGEGTRVGRSVQGRASSW